MNEQERETMSAAATAIPISMPDSSDQLAQLFADHDRRVLLAAYRITGSMADAEDVVQTVFLRLGSGEGGPGKDARSYLYRGAITDALALLRRRKISLVEPIDAAEGI